MDRAKDGHRLCHDPKLAADPAGLQIGTPQGGRMAAMKSLGTVSLMLGLAGCVAPPPVPLIAVPGPSKTEATFQQDDAACRTAATQPPPVVQPVATSGPTSTTAPAPANGQAAPQPVAAQPPTLPPGTAYLHCMAAQGNPVVPLPSVQPAYGYYPPYPAYPGYYGYGYYPWLYGGGFVGFGFYGGCCGPWYGRGWGSWGGWGRGSWGGGWGGWGRGGFRR